MKKWNDQVYFLLDIILLWGILAKSGRKWGLSLILNININSILSIGCGEIMLELVICIWIDLWGSHRRLFKKFGVWMS